MAKRLDEALTASAARQATHEYGSAAPLGSPVYGIDSAIGGRLMVVAGGLPISHKGDVADVIGISSGTAAQDQQVAQAGINFGMRNFDYADAGCKTRVGDHRPRVSFYRWAALTLRCEAWSKGSV